MCLSLSTYACKKAQIGINTHHSPSSLIGRAMKKSVVKEREGDRGYLIKGGFIDFLCTGRKDWQLKIF
jgi:hypothetical protein